MSTERSGEKESPRTIFDVVGEEGIRRLVGAFYRQVPTDDVLGPMYPPGELADAEERLALFLIYRLGGPQTYIEERGHPRLRQRHAPFPIGLAARDRWLALMDRALEESGVAPEVVQFLRPFFRDIATFLMNC